MRGRLLASYLLLVAGILVVLELPLAIGYDRRAQQELTVRVERDAVGFASFADEVFDARNSQERMTAQQALDKGARAYARRTNARVVIINPRGQALVDTSVKPSDPTRNSFETRPEFATALKGRVASGDRISRTLGYRLLYVAVPISSGGEVHGAVRVSHPMAEVDRRIHRYWLLLAGIGAMSFAAASAVAMLMASWVTAPLDQLLDTTSAVGAGDLSARVLSSSGPPEIRALSASFNRMVGELEHLVTAQSQFVADASHQLRTPLTALGLRLEEAATAPDPHDDLSAARVEVVRLTNIIDGLLVLARASEHDDAIAQCDLTLVATERANQWATLAAERGISLDVTAPDSMIVTGVDGAVEQILDNLIDNALDFAPSGSTVHIDVTRRPNSSCADLRVIDDGPGMTKEQRTAAVERFWQAPNRQGGSGLGLAIVKRLAEASGGRIDLEATHPDGRGLTVVVCFQRAG